jgi:hypothetical protein
MRLIDSRGRQFTWGYNIAQKSNYPDKLVGQLTVDDREIIYATYSAERNCTADLPK